MFYTKITYSTHCKACRNNLWLRLDVDIGRKGIKLERIPNQLWYWNGPQLKSVVWMAIKLAFKIPSKTEGWGYESVARGHKCSEFRAGVGLDFQFWILVHPNNDIWAIEWQIWILRLNVFELSNVNFEFWGWMSTSKQTSCYRFYIVVVNIAYTFSVCPIL